MTFFNILDAIKRGFSFTRTEKLEVVSTVDDPVPEITIKFNGGVNGATLYVHHNSGSFMPTNWQNLKASLVLQKKTIPLAVCAETSTAVTQAESATNLVFNIERGGITKVYIPTPEGATAVTKRFCLIPTEPVLEPICGFSITANIANPYNSTITYNF